MADNRTDVYSKEIPSQSYPLLKPCREEHNPIPNTVQARQQQLSVRSRPMLFNLTTRALSAAVAVTVARAHRRSQQAWSGTRRESHSYQRGGRHFRWKLPLRLVNSKQHI